ncbi:MAG: thioredoxin [Lachnoclostridium sp.]|nr:thioredoxin [Lachnoclostridium sp.]
MTFTDENVKEIITSGQPVVIDFWATWCGPCMKMAPMIEELAKEYEGRAVIGKYNIEEENDLTMDYAIRSIPTLLFFKNGEQVKDLRMAGSQRRDDVVANIDKLIAL